MVGRKRLDAIHADTQRVYDTHGAQFERDRNRSLFEKPGLDRFCAGFPKSARVLDLGCGGGGVIATYLIDQGFQLMYAFTKEHAARSFREAWKRDPDCAICYWGEAWAWGAGRDSGSEEATLVLLLVLVRAATAAVAVEA